MSYRALPKSLHIQDSPVEGQGLFAKETIPIGTHLGMSHIVIIDYLDNEIIYRTPLGGFINHSDNPNCLKYYEDKFYFIRTTKNIKAGEELFLQYSFYNINE